jgi:DivIVA domain-containing protein
MTDDTFHLTPHDVRAQEFQRTLRGVDPAQVENFKERVAEELDRVLRDRVRLEERMKGLHEQLRAYRERERALNDALVAAQQLRADVQAQATREAEVIVAEARQEGGRLVAAAEHEVRTTETRAEAAAHLLRKYINTFRQILMRHQAELDSIEAYLEPERAIPETESHEARTS